jgi:hypothetical protein
MYVCPELQERFENAANLGLLIKRGKIIIIIQRENNLYYTLYHRWHTYRWDFNDVFPCTWRNKHSQSASTKTQATGLPLLSIHIISENFAVFMRSLLPTWIIQQDCCRCSIMVQIRCTIPVVSDLLPNEVYSGCSSKHTNLKIADNCSWC